MAIYKNQLMLLQVSSQAINHNMKVKDVILKLFPVKNEERHKVINKYTEDMLRIQVAAKRQNVESKKKLDQTLVIAKAMGII